MDIKRKDIVVIRSNKILMFCFSCVFIFALIPGFAYGQIRIAALEQSTNSQWLEGATLKTDSSVDELMVRAEQFSKQGRYDLASSLWQTVIDSSNDLVFSNDEWIEKTLSHQYELYRSVSGEIEDALSALPIEGIKGYRLNADAEAKEVLSSYVEEDREKALAEVVQRYFLSSFGDDAAFELACLKFFLQSVYLRRSLMIILILTLIELKLF